MIQETHTITSPCKGIIEKVLITEDSYVYEWEKLIFIKTPEGNMEEISVGASGTITSLCIKEGDSVSTESILALLKDDLLITGSD
ncbi:hypothetical protein [Halalkalibacter flavus]|jgi:biotin carboxyl carrier protein|uniref:hypothetical protein n=1 Tax=Halalkalibacter flavus TaxID=3090668 RepID=UPI002FC7F1E3